MHRIIVQPHTDDAYLSLHSHMVRWIKQGDLVTIATCWAGTRYFEAENYANAIKAEHQSLWDQDEHHPEYKEAPAGEGPALYIPRLPESAEHWYDNLVYLPLGIQHQEHKTVSRMTLPGCHVSWYLDHPYYAKTTKHDEVNELMKDRKVVSFEAPSGRKYHDKFTKIFKTQSMFFHYNTEKLKGLPEVILGGI